jgi:ABC-type multidrug transport system fused ATPase/permease subunit
MKKHLTLSDILLIAINLIPVWGVWFRGWNPRQMFIVYCCETIIIGLINVLKMLIVAFTKKQSVEQTDKNQPAGIGGSIFIVLFFIVHYGFFVTIQLNMFLGISGILETGTSLNIIPKIPALLHPEAKLMLLIFTVGYGMQVIFEFFIKGEYKTVSIMQLMFEPYIRIFVQQFIVIIGSFFLMFGAGKMFVIVYAGCIIFFSFFNMKRLIKLATLKEQRKKDGEKNKV